MREFAIHLLGANERNLNGIPLGQIEVGDFRERFSCYPFSRTISEFETKWKSELKRLIEGASVAFLQYEPKFAWAVYREGEYCFVREVLAIDGDFSKHSERSPEIEGGEKINEWKTTVSAVRRFLEAGPVVASGEDWQPF